MAVSLLLRLTLLLLTFFALILQKLAFFMKGDIQEAASKDGWTDFAFTRLLLYSTFSFLHLLRLSLSTLLHFYFFSLHLTKVAYFHYRLIPTSKPNLN
jgi:hypothetical protein